MTMSFLFLFVILPSLGVIWFLNLITFIEKLHKGKDTHNQKILGSVWTFIFIALLLFCFISLVD